MASRANSSVILLPIHPEYADKIFSRKKRVEFRKMAIPCNVKVVLVYVTKPQSAVVGYFLVQKVIEGTAASLWKEFSPVAGIDKKDFLRYYNGAALGKGLVIKKACRFKSPLRLGAIGWKSRGAPQSFFYIESVKWQTLLARENDSIKR